MNHRQSLSKHIFLISQCTVGVTDSQSLPCPESRHMNSVLDEQLTHLSSVPVSSPDNRGVWFLQSNRM